MRWRRGVLCLLLALGGWPAAYAEDQPTWLEGTVLPGLPAVVDSGLRLEINIPAKELTVIDHHRVVGTHKVAIGQPAWPSPEMSNQQITRIEWNPSWVPPNSPWARGASVAPPGPNNPLGPVKMPISDGIRIHGTNKPGSVGHAASHGCFRMNSEEARNLAWYIQERTTTQNDPSILQKYIKNRYQTYVVKLDQPVAVEVVYQTVAVKDGTVHLYPDVYRKVRNWETEIRSALARAGYDAEPLTATAIETLTHQVRKGPVAITVDELLQPRVAVK